METTFAATGSANAFAATIDAIPSIDDIGAKSNVDYSEADNCGYYGKKFIGGTEFTDYTEDPDDIFYDGFTESAGCDEYLNYTGFTGDTDFFYVHVALEDVTGLSDSIILGNEESEQDLASWSVDLVT